MTLSELPHESPEAYQALLEDRFLTIRAELGRVTTAICKIQGEHSAVAAQLGGIAHKLGRWQPRLIRAQLNTHSLLLRSELGEIAATLPEIQTEFIELLEQRGIVLPELYRRWKEHREVHPARFEDPCWDCETYDPVKLRMESEPHTDISPAAEMDILPATEAA